jgi:hypothetical protein
MILGSRFWVLGVSLLTLVGCSGAAETLGLGRNAPDEFAVVDHPPLSLPPDYALRPPQPGAARPQAVSMPDRANKVLFGEETQASATQQTDAEKVLLTEAGAEKAQNNIRQIIDQESDKAVGSRHLVRDMLGLSDENGASTTVNAPEEAKRLREAKETGEKATASPTPIIEKSKDGWLF